MTVFLIILLIQDNIYSNDRRRLVFAQLTIYTFAQTNLQINIITSNILACLTLYNEDAELIYDAFNVAIYKLKPQA